MITTFATSIRKMYLCIKFNNKNRMSKEIAEKKMLPCTPFNIKEVSPEEKKALLLFLMPKGFSIATFYKRFFQKGFSTWELVGVKECKRRFLVLPEVKQKILSRTLPRIFRFRWRTKTTGVFMQHSRNGVKAFAKNSPLS